VPAEDSKPQSVDTSHAGPSTNQPRSSARGFAALAACGISSFAVAALALDAALHPVNGLASWLAVPDLPQLDSPMAIEELPGLVAGFLVNSTRGEQDFGSRPRSWLSLGKLAQECEGHLAEARRLVVEQESLIRVVHPKAFPYVPRRSGPKPKKPDVLTPPLNSWPPAPAPDLGFNIADYDAIAAIDHTNRGSMSNLFSVIDKDKSTTLDASEMRVALRGTLKVSQTTQSDLFLAHSMANFATLSAKGTGPCPTIGQPRGSCQIDFDNFCRFFQAFKIEMKANALLDIMDLDLDSSISMQEIRKARKTGMPGSPRDVLQVLGRLHDADANHDHIITRAELQRHLSPMAEREYYMPPPIVPAHKRYPRKEERPR